VLRPIRAARAHICVYIGSTGIGVHIRTTLGDERERHSRPDLDFLLNAPHVVIQRVRDVIEQPFG
jgi:hypothetical protein